MRKNVPDPCGEVEDITWLAGEESLELLPMRLAIKMSQNSS